MLGKAGYLCPFCGKPTTGVYRSTALPHCVVRVRRCLECGHHHETVEIPMEITKAIKQSVELLAEENMKKNVK